MDEASHFGKEGSKAEVEDADNVQKLVNPMECMNLKEKEVEETADKRKQQKEEDFKEVEDAANQKEQPKEGEFKEVNAFTSSKTIEKVSSHSTDFEKNTLRTLRRCLASAKNPGEHHLILKDQSIMNMLILFLGHESIPIVRGAIQVFQVLSQWRRNHVTLLETQYFEKALHSTAQTKAYPDDLRIAAKDLLHKIKQTKPPLGQHPPDNSVNTVSHGKQGDKFSHSLSKSRNDGKDDSIKAPKDKQTVIYVSKQMLHKPSVRQEITGALVRIRGIISVTFSLSRDLCLVRGKMHVPSDQFAQTIANLGYECYLVVKNDLKEELYIPVSAQRSSEEESEVGKENSYPDYLSDEEETVARPNTAIKEKRDEENDTWLSSASRFLQKSFYW